MENNDINVYQPSVHLYRDQIINDQVFHHVKIDDIPVRWLSVLDVPVINYDVKVMLDVSLLVSSKARSEMIDNITHALSRNISTINQINTVKFTQQFPNPTYTTNENPFLFIKIDQQGTRTLLERDENRLTTEMIEIFFKNIDEKNSTFDAIKIILDQNNLNMVYTIASKDHLQKADTEVPSQSMTEYLKKITSTSDNPTVIQYFKHNPQTKSWIIPSFNTSISVEIPKTIGKLFTSTSKKFIMEPYTTNNNTDGYVIKDQQEIEKEFLEFFSTRLMYRPQPQTQPQPLQISPDTTTSIPYERNLIEYQPQRRRALPSNIVDDEDDIIEENITKTKKKKRKSPPNGTLIRATDDSLEQSYTRQYNESEEEQDYGGPVTPPTTTNIDVTTPLRRRSIPRRPTETNSNSRPPLAKELDSKVVSKQQIDHFEKLSDLIKSAYNQIEEGKGIEKLDQITNHPFFIIKDLQKESFKRKGVKITIGDTQNILTNEYLEFLKAFKKNPDMITCSFPIVNYRNNGKFKSGFDVEWSENDFTRKKYAKIVRNLSKLIYPSHKSDLEENPIFFKPTVLLYNWIMFRMLSIFLVDDDYKQIFSTLSEYFYIVSPHIYYGNKICKNSASGVSTEITRKDNEPSIVSFFAAKINDIYDGKRERWNITYDKIGSGLNSFWNETLKKIKKKQITNKFISLFFQQFEVLRLGGCDPVWFHESEYSILIHHDTYTIPRTFRQVTNFPALPINSKKRKRDEDEEDVNEESLVQNKKRRRKSSSLSSSSSSKKSSPKKPSPKKSPKKKSPRGSPKKKQSTTTDVPDPTNDIDLRKNNPKIRAVASSILKNQANSQQKNITEEIYSIESDEEESEESEEEQSQNEEEEQQPKNNGKEEQEDQYQSQSEEDSQVFTQPPNNEEQSMELQSSSKEEDQEEQSMELEKENKLQSCNKETNQGMELLEQDTVDKKKQQNVEPPQEKEKENENENEFLNDYQPIPSFATYPTEKSSDNEHKTDDEQQQEESNFTRMDEESDEDNKIQYDPILPQSPSDDEELNSTLIPQVTSLPPNSFTSGIDINQILQKEAAYQFALKKNNQV